MVAPVHDFSQFAGLRAMAENNDPAAIGLEISDTASETSAPSKQSATAPKCRSRKDCGSWSAGVVTSTPV